MSIIEFGEATVKDFPFDLEEVVSKRCFAHTPILCLTANAPCEEPTPHGCLTVAHMKKPKTSSTTTMVERFNHGLLLMKAFVFGTDADADADVHQ